MKIKAYYGYIRSHVTHNHVQTVTFTSYFNTNSIIAQCLYRNPLCFST